MVLNVEFKADTLAEVERARCYLDAYKVEISKEEVSPDRVRELSLSLRIVLSKICDKVLVSDPVVTPPPLY